MLLEKDGNDKYKRLRFYDMKKSIFKLGALSISLLSLALLFKLMHWPGGNIMLILTLGGLVPVTSFLTAQYLGKEEDENQEV